VVGVQPHTHTLAPVPALLALVPLAFLLSGGILPGLLRGVTFARPVASSGRTKE
jgi:hypothetical protein